MMQNKDKDMLEAEVVDGAIAILTQSKRNCCILLPNRGIVNIDGLETHFSPEAIEKYPINFLDLSHNQIENIGVLKHLPPGITHIDLSYNNISDIGALKDLPLSVRRLDISNNKVTDRAAVSELTVRNPNLSVYWYT